MIHIVIRHPTSSDLVSGIKTPTAELHIWNEELKQFQVLLNRALNCVPPEDPQWKDWFELSDRLEKII